MKPRKVILTIEATTVLPLSVLRDVRRVTCKDGDWGESDLYRYDTDGFVDSIDQITVQVVQPAKPAKARRKGSK